MQTERQNDRTRPSKRARAEADEIRTVWRDRAGLALTIAIMTLFWVILAGDASAFERREHGAFGLDREYAIDGARTGSPFQARAHPLDERSALGTILVPEPDTAIMTGLGLGGLAWVSRRQARRASRTTD